ncbi:hypothetical protein N8072_01475 [bacterium]|jgi:hypothetical protein|nr:hypothetical protein [bacterium]MDB4128591.1 hypothetical protein [bacterium]MDC1257324.1 hypothetical protein [bacterium]
MKYDYNDEDTVEVICTDNDVNVEGTILNWHGDTLTVNVNGIILKFKKYKPNLYVARMSGMEFTIRMKND